MSKIKKSTYKYYWLCSDWTTKVFTLLLIIKAKIKHNKIAPCMEKEYIPQEERILIKPILCT